MFGMIFFFQFLTFFQMHCRTVIFMFGMIFAAVSCLMFTAFEFALRGLDMNSEQHRQIEQIE